MGKMKLLLRGDCDLLKYQQDIITVSDNVSDDFRFDASFFKDLIKKNTLWDDAS